MRVRNWPSVLARTIEEYRHKPLKWGENDCALFAANIIQALTGVDHAARFRGIYSTEDEADIIIINHGGLRMLATAALGPEIDPNFAQRGDLVLMNRGEGKAPMFTICIGTKCVVPDKSGLAFIKMDGAIAAWRVG